MQIKTIEVRAGRTFNHPHEQYSNLQPSVTMVAELSEGEDASEAAKSLQQRAEGLVEDHKQNLLKSINDLYEMTERKAELTGLERQLRSAQQRIEDIRAAHPQLNLLAEKAD